MSNYCKEKHCAYCGNPFMAKSPATLYCSTECYNATRRKGYRFRESKEELEEIKNAGDDGAEEISDRTNPVAKSKPRKRKKKSFKSLDEVCREAREHGMSYGQYVARYGV